jgi:hypothetical protein
VPVNITPGVALENRGVPEPLQYIGTIAHAPFKASFVKSLVRENDFFGIPEDEDELEPFVGDSVLQWDVSRHDIVNAPFLLYDEHGSGLSDDARIAVRGEIAARVRSIAPNTLLLVRLIGESDVRVSSWQELLAPSLPTHRFIYSILVNSERYLGPLLEAALGEECDVRVTWGASSGPEYRAYLPTAPQFRSAPMLDLAGSTPFNLLKAIALADDSEAAALAQFLDGKIATVSLGDFVRDNCLVGTGKYPPLNYKGKLKRMLKALVNLGLALRDEQTDAIVISDAGARLLDMLPHRLFDPDMRLRWFDRDTDLIRPENADASERWLRSYYGVMRNAALRHGVRAEYEFDGSLTSEMLNLLTED